MTVVSYVYIYRCAMSKLVVDDEPSSLAAVSSGDCLSADGNAATVSNCCSHATSTSVPGADFDNCAMRHFAWISQYAPRFTVSGNNVHVLTEPSEFYETLKVCSPLSA